MLCFLAPQNIGSHLYLECFGVTICSEMLFLARSVKFNASPNVMASFAMKIVTCQCKGKTCFFCCCCWISQNCNSLIQVFAGGGFQCPGRLDRFSLRVITWSDHHAQSRLGSPTASSRCGYQGHINMNLIHLCLRQGTCKCRGEVRGV